MVRHGTAEVGADPEGELPGQIGQIRGQGGGLADQLAGQFHHVPQGIGHLAGQTFEIAMAIADAVFDPAHHPHPKGGFAHDVEDPKALLTEGHDVAAVVLLGLAVEDLGAAADLRHALLLGIPAHHAEAAVLGHHRAQHHAVARLEDVEWQHFLGEEHHVGEGEQGQFPHGQFTHAITAAGRARPQGPAGKGKRVNRTGPKRLVES